MARRRTNPLQRQVNAAIAGQIRPIQSGITASGNQAAAEQKAIAGAHNALDTNLGQIGSDLGNLSGRMLADAGESSTQYGIHRAQNMDFLRGVLGPDANYLHDVNTFAGSRDTMENVANVAGIGLNGASYQGNVAGMRGASQMRGNEDRQLSLIADRERKRQLQAQIAAIRAQSPFLRRQFQRENLDDSIKRAELALRRREMTNAEARQAFDMDFNNRQLAAQAGAAQTEAAQKMTDDLRKQIQDYYKTSYLVQVKNEYGDVTGTKLPKTPFRKAFADLVNMDVPPAIAAQYAARWTDGNAATWGNTLALKTRKARWFNSYLRRQGVPKATVNAILKSAYGNGWRALLRPQARELSGG